MSWYTRVLALLVLVLMVSVAGVQADEHVRLNLLVTWDLGIRLGVDHRPTELYGYTVNVGTTLPGLIEAPQITGDASFGLHLLTPEVGWQASVLAGLVDFRMVFTDPPAVAATFGASARVGYEFEGPWGLFGRAGLGYPWFVEDEEVRSGSNALLGLWPDLAVGGTLEL